MERAVELKNLSKSYHNTPVLSNLNLNIPKGTIFGLIGPNGAGKSTLIGILTGLLDYKKGEVLIHGMPFNAENEIEIKKITASVLQPPLLFEQFSSIEFVEYVCDVYEVEKNGLVEKAYSLLDYFEIKDFAKIKISKLSSGSRKKLAFVTSVLVQPKLLLLDEPFEAVDVISIERMKNIIRRLKASGTTIIITSHILEVVENLCDDIAILHHGRIEAYLDSETRRELQKNSNLHDIFEQYVPVEKKEDQVDWL